MERDSALLGEGSIPFIKLRGKLSGYPEKPPFWSGDNVTTWHTDPYIRTSGTVPRSRPVLSCPSTPPPSISSGMIQVGWRHTQTHTTPHTPNTDRRFPPALALITQPGFSCDWAGPSLFGEFAGLHVLAPPIPPFPHLLSSLL